MTALSKARVVLAAIGLCSVVLIEGWLILFKSQDTNLSQGEALAAARESAVYITHDEPILDTQVVRTTYADAFSAGGGDTPPEAPVWRVSFKGLFYEPEGPPPLPGEPRPVRTPTCAQITVVVDDATANELVLTFGRSTGC